jgi:hypothetical protein
VHTHHRSNSSGSECYNCHMPHTTYGVLKAIRSHQISSPRISDQLATGRPNACSLCHLDKSLASAAEQLHGWYAHAKPDLSREQHDVAESVRLALVGDAGQRALMAWHFAWAPALEVSQSAWVPPILGQLLDDPYAAVRCIAERSMKSFGVLLPQSYDFTVSPEERMPAGTIVLENWRKQPSSLQGDPVQTLANRNDPERMRQAFEQLIQQRNNSAVRLRE